MKTTRVMLVLLFVIILLTQFSRGSSTVRQHYSEDVLNQPSCPGECKKKATTVDATLSLIGFVVSAFVSVSPLMRVIKEVNGQENVAKYKWFMAFLALLTLDYIAWVGYSLRGCQYCEAAAYMIISSIFGAMVSCLWALLGLVRDRGHVADQDDKVMLAISFVTIGVIIGYGSYRTESGYYALAGAVAAHLCRFMGTDYTRLSPAQFIVSFIGSVSGFLCIRHPDLAAARPFRLTSIVIAGFRGLECVWWTVLFLRSSPRPRRSLQDARAWIAGARA